MGDSSRVLLLEDDQQQRQQLRTIFEFIGYDTVILCSGGWETRIGVAPEGCLAVVVGRSSRTMDVLRQLNRQCPGLPILVNGTFDTGTLPGNLKRQVIGTLSQPLAYGQIVSVLHLAQIYRLQCRQGQVLLENSSVSLFRGLVGNSRAVRHLRALMSQVVDKDVEILVTGESGAGKAVVAHNLHCHSSRKTGLFVPVSCAAIPEDLLESELFGHEKGAFKGAIAERKGRVELAEGGTLFLDEVGSMPLAIQLKLLRVLEEKKFERIGGSVSINSNVRVMAGSRCDLEALVAQGRFREDLYYRLNLFPIEVPPLRQRPSDIPLIINDILNRMACEKRSGVRFHSSAMLSLCRYGWPGNLRELVNLVERLAVMYPMSIVGIDELPERFRVEESAGEGDAGRVSSFSGAMQSGGLGGLDELAVLPVDGMDLKQFLADLERRLIRQALDDCGNVVARAADRLRIRRTTLVEKMRKYGLNRYESADNSSSLS
ncbi:MAG: sigma-54 dependent transcriptional regulator [Kistimonas sp.]|nr:sigma-54 dependent transcriptional regulator [Kistimonas sp.]